MTEWRAETAIRRLLGPGILVLALASPAAAQIPESGAPPPPAAGDQGKGKPKPAPPRFEWAEHPTLHLGHLTLSFRARFQTDMKRSDAPLDDDLEVPLKRVGIDGLIANAVHFQVDHELDDPDRWKDVYVDYQQFEQVQLQAGKFKIPFGLDQNVGITQQNFIYRSLIGQRLAPARDRGVMVHGRVFNRILRYDVGVFRHDGRTAEPSEDSTRVQAGQTKAAHIAVVPFRTMHDAVSDLLVGLAITQSDVPEGFPTIRGRSQLGPLFYRSDIWVKGRRERRAFEFRWRTGPFSASAEHMRVTDERLGQGVEDNDLSPFLITGWYVAGTWVITGENKENGPERAKHPLFQGGAGAFEVAARIEELKFGSVATGEPPSTSPRADIIISNANRVATVGVTWYPNRWVKIQFNMIKETLTDPAQGPLPAQPSYWSRVVRFQFVM